MKLLKTVYVQVVSKLAKRDQSFHINIKLLIQLGNFHCHLYVSYFSNDEEEHSCDQSTKDDKADYFHRLSDCCVCSCGG